jgi:alkylation response protein AidB-like acyl-CoA dehydrogenase
MYSFTPTEEQQMLIDAVTRFANNDLRPAAREADEEAHLPPALIEKGWELGVLQASIPEEYDGFGEYSTLTGVLAAEPMARGDLSAAMAVMVPNLFVLPILLTGTEEQKEAFIPPVIEAEWKPYTAALIEPNLDFDPLDLQTTATSVQDGYQLSGEKTYVPCAKEAESLLVYADLEGETRGFIVPGDSEGLVVGERQKLLGLNAVPFSPITLENLHVPEDHLLGGQENYDFERILASSRAALAAMAVGVAQAAFEYARDYAKDREVFGVKVAQKQAIAFMLAEMATEIEAIRLLAWEAAWMLDHQKPDAYKEAFLALHGAIDMALMVTDRAVQILGGHGYVRDHPVEMWLRNARGFATFTGLAMV